ncbi:unnamed protein product [Clonostachys chloroleuca]|uniref:Uncharacterized protein n=1 Tax=Clonostachys chloroleuca TaxID=1926264 RepID=A0AA35LUI1_9HYPO|nr:unnamed protein product [Clonostachys chloroleuca]
MAFQWDIFQNNQGDSNPEFLFYGLDISSLEPSDVNADNLLIDPALEHPDLMKTRLSVWDIPEKEQASSSRQETGLEIKALHGSSSEQALDDLRSEFRKLIEEQESRWEKKFQALEQESRSEMRALEQEIRSEIQALRQRVDKIKVEFESELVKFCTEIDAYIKKLRAWATEAKLCVDKAVELQTD